MSKSRAKWKPGEAVGSMAELAIYVEKWMKAPDPRHALVFYAWRSRVERPLSWSWIQNLQYHVIDRLIKRGMLKYAVRRGDRA